MTLSSGKPHVWLQGIIKHYMFTSSYANINDTTWYNCKVVWTLDLSGNIKFYIGQAEVTMLRYIYQQHFSPSVTPQLKLPQELHNAQGYIHVNPIIAVVITDAEIAVWLSTCTHREMLKFMLMGDLKQVHSIHTYKYAYGLRFDVLRCGYVLVPLAHISALHLCYYDSKNISIRLPKCQWSNHKRYYWIDLIDYNELLIWPQQGETHGNHAHILW